MEIFDPEFRSPISSEKLNLFNSYGLIGALGITVTDVDNEKTLGYLEIDQRHMAPNGYLHAGTVLSLADTLCGIGCQLSLPQDASTFTTIEIKSNFFSTAVAGKILGTARALHRGRSTQVWDCTVTSEVTGKIMSEFRCTQLVVYPREDS